MFEFFYKKTRLSYVEGSFFLVKIQNLLPFKKISLYLRRKSKTMTTYQIQINERMTLGKNLVALLQSMPRVVTFKKPIEDEEETISKKEILEDLNEAFREVKLMMDGKKRKKTLDELIDELRKEQQDELRNSTNA